MLTVGVGLDWTFLRNLKKGERERERERERGAGGIERESER